MCAASDGFILDGSAPSRAPDVCVRSPLGELCGNGTEVPALPYDIDGIAAGVAAAWGDCVATSGVRGFRWSLETVVVDVGGGWSGAAAGCAATNVTLSRQLHHGARYHVTLEAANGVGCAWQPIVGVHRRPLDWAAAVALGDRRRGGDAVDSISNRAPCPSSGRAVTPADAVAVSSPHYNASGNATRAGVPARTNLAFSFAVLIHEKTNLSKDEVQELSLDAADLPQGNGSAFPTNQSCPRRGRARRRPRTARGGWSSCRSRFAPTLAPRPSAGPARFST